MTDQHPITPPPELVREWQREANHNEAMFPQVATFAAQWGADQELDACCEWTQSYAECGDSLRAARRPKPPSLNEVALQMLNTIERDAHYLPEITDTIRRALERLKKLEEATND